MWLKWKKIWQSKTLSIYYVIGYCILKVLLVQCSEIWKLWGNYFFLRSIEYIEIYLSIVLLRNRVIVRKSQTSNIWVNADTALSLYVKKYSTYFNRKDVCAHLNIYFRVDEQRHIVNRLRSRQPLFLFLKKGIKYIDHLESITFTLRLYYDFQQTYWFFHESK